MPVFRRRKMCAECPFRANAIPEWLGPHTAEHLQQVIHSEAGYICHLDINRRSDRGETPDKIAEQGQHCVGMARYRNSVLKSPRDREACTWQHSLEGVPDKPVIPAFKFLEYHTKQI